MRPTEADLQYSGAAASFERLRVWGLHHLVPHNLRALAPPTVDTKEFA